MGACCSSGAAAAGSFAVIVTYCLTSANSNGACTNMCQSSSLTNSICTQGQTGMMRADISSRTDASLVFGTWWNQYSCVGAPSSSIQLYNGQCQSAVNLNGVLYNTRATWSTSLAAPEVNITRDAARLLRGGQV